MTLIFKFAAALSIAALSACSSGSGEIGEQVAIIGELREAVKSNRAARSAPQAGPVITRAFLNTVTVPSLEVGIENFGQTAFLVPAARRKDNAKGDITVWKTVDGENIIVRSGVLVGTKGLGRDLASSDASAAVKSVSRRSAGGGIRTMYVRNDLNGIDELRMQCEITVAGTRAISIIERSYNTVLLKERCTYESFEITNDYWVDLTGSVRQSRQWAGPYLGYIKTRLLKK